MKVEGGLFVRKGDQQQEAGGQERVMGGEYDQNT
jgi:hypothetical protein